MRLRRQGGGLSNARAVGEMGQDGRELVLRQVGVE
jgi:hypothetical protein